VRVARDPEVEEILTWFGVTHELVMTGFGAYWRMAWLPGPGGVGEQDARLLAGLSATKSVMQATLADTLRSTRSEAGGHAERPETTRPRR
jgi:hypothetical protein